ncbi:hypothetical protein ACP70R_023172 [Stipagrostis hirtigluma subsp. patula]
MSILTDSRAICFIPWEPYPTEVSISGARFGVPEVRVAGEGSNQTHHLSPCYFPQMLANKLVVIIGATGTGKTKLSIDVAKVIGGEVLNADKMQIYAGLDITTNKVRLQDRCGIPHHLIGAISGIGSDLPVSLFRSLATATANSIVRRGHVPIVAGGSNKLIHGFLVDYFDSSLVNPFALVNYYPTLRSQTCILWVHASEIILNEYLNRRVDDMVDAGMIEEIKDYYDYISSNNYFERTGLSKAIGVAELGEYFKGHKSRCDAIAEIKANTQVLAKTQIARIRHMVDVWGWPVCFLDATETIRAHLNGSKYTMEAMAWERDVSGPGLKAISEFFSKFNDV